ncbi:HD domain-containing protein [Sphingopyxis solisilvae]|uniref:HD domain-containing protein n=1 Tax=Sphingopyxis solisilvae TaxID=1886788 RepID=UPI001892A44C|nr:HD domain-containing protein [Sphingopyxis solisilvae]
MIVMDSRRISDEIAERTGICLPDTKLVAEAIEKAYANGSPMLFNHVMRSALFAHAFTDQRPNSEDRELIIVSAVLHDLGLAEHRCPGIERFEIRSANLARDFAVERGMAGDRAWLLWDIIALHPYDFNLHKEDEAWAVQMGILADVVGAGIDLIDPAVVARIVACYPRLNFKSGFYRLLASEAATSPPPPCHPVTMIRYHELGEYDVPNARDLIAGAPFDD